MEQLTRNAYNQYCDDIAKLNGITNVAQKFTITPAVEQILEKRISEKADFLGKINIMNVRDQAGEIILMDMTNPIASRTNTNAKVRETKSDLSLENRKYQTQKTDSDIHIKYNLLDAWSKFPDFQTKLRDLILTRMAKDKLLVGFHGVKSDIDTDPSKNKMLQDLNIGWLQHLRNDAPERVMTAPKIGDQSGADHKNFDALVLDMKSSLIDPWHQSDTSLKCFIGGNILTDKYVGLLNSADKPSEQSHVNSMLSSKALGGMQVEIVPFFPENSILITSHDNLSIYNQTSSRRRHITDNPARDQIDDFNSVNSAYVIQNLGKICMAENILQPNAAGDAWIAK